MQRDEIASRFLDVLPYAPYAFQEEALLAWFESDAGVLVCAPTGMGKTLIAEAAVFEALHSRRPLYYTTPLIALTDQKFRELRERAVEWGFSADDVGLITGNRRENPDALVRVVVAEILLNHLLDDRGSLARHEGARETAEWLGVVMDEFHSFNDPERGIVWELSLKLLPRSVRVMLLSATVGNPHAFADWLRDRGDRRLVVVTTAERRVPLEFHWVEDKFLNEHLRDMTEGDESTRRTPALVFCFNRDECWEVAEQLKGQPLVGAATKAELERRLETWSEALSAGVGPKLRQMLQRGVGVHHAGVLPRHKHIVEELFLARLVPFVVCTETLAAGINLPARSVVMTTLLKGKPGERKLVPAGTGHQIFGRAGRPQFDVRGFVFALAHEDDARIAKWRKRYEQIDPNSKDPGILRARKEMERKRPTRRKTEQYWSEGQFKSIIAAGPASLQSRSMIPYHVLVYLLTRSGRLNDVRAFLAGRFAPAERIERFQQQLDHMIGNLAGLGYLQRACDEDHVTLSDSIFALLNFRSVDPLYGGFLAGLLSRGDSTEKIAALESVLILPPGVVRKAMLPEREPGPLEANEIRPLAMTLGLLSTELSPDDQGEDDEGGYWDEPDTQRPPTFPEILQRIFEKQLPSPEPVLVQPKWLAGAAYEQEPDFFKLVKRLDLVKSEGLVLRHLLRFVILAGEFAAFSQDPAYDELSGRLTEICRSVDESYTQRFLAAVAEERSAAQAR